MFTYYTGLNLAKNPGVRRARVQNTKAREREPYHRGRVRRRFVPIFFSTVETTARVRVCPAVRPGRRIVRDIGITFRHALCH